MRAQELKKKVPITSACESDDFLFETSSNISIVSMTETGTAFFAGRSPSSSNRINQIESIRPNRSNPNNRWITSYGNPRSWHRGSGRINRLVFEDENQHNGQKPINSNKHNAQGNTSCHRV
jgi:hypothetical protein